MNRVLGMIYFGAKDNNIIISMLRSDLLTSSVAIHIVKTLLYSKKLLSYRAFSLARAMNRQTPP